MRIVWLIFFTLPLVAACTTDTNSEEEEVIENEQVIRIYSDSIGWDKKLPCKITYVGKKYDAEIKFRGGMSSKYPKHSMTVEFDDQVAIGNLPANDDWIFNASYIDKTFQRHKLSYEVFCMMNERNKAPGCDYLPIYLNDKYIGLYVIMEKVNGSWLEFDKDNPQGARLFKDPFVFVQERLPNVQEPDNYYQQKFPKQSDKDCNHELDAFKTFLFKSDDETFIAEYKNWVDEQSVIDLHLLLLLTNNDDGVIKNFYLYRTPGDKRLKFIPWDYDHSFGRDGNYELNLIEREVGWQKSILLKRLMELPETGYPKRLKSKYWEYRRVLFTSIPSLVENNGKILKPYLEENAKAWPLDAKWYFDANDYDQEVEIIKKYMPMRLEQLDAFFSNLEYGEKE
ncbi:MAG: CotH kinase family protein [bacterium]|nr:CotH kinase family protein [bacterium]